MLEWSGWNCAGRPVLLFQVGKWEDSVGLLVEERLVGPVIECLAWEKEVRK